MKRICVSIGAILLLGHLSTSAQIDSALGYYPLSIGNVWQYWYHYKIAFTTDSLSTFSLVEVTGDTLMPNGKWYKVIRRTGPVTPRGFSPPRQFERVDSLTANVYTYESYFPSGELVSDSLRARGGDRSGISMMCYGTAAMTVLGVQTTVKAFHNVSPFTPAYNLAYGLGMNMITTEQDNPVYPLYDHFIAELVYAKINGREYGVLTDLKVTNGILPSGIRLEQNYPNPFNPSTTIRYGIPARSHVSLTVYNALGQQVSVLQSGEAETGYHEVRFDGGNLATGIYFYRLQVRPLDSAIGLDSKGGAGDFVQTKKLVLIR